MSKSDLVDIDVAVEHRTEKAALVHTGNKENAVWVPLSQVEIEETGIGGIFTLTLPEWLAIDKGLV